MVKHLREKNQLYFNGIAGLFLSFFLTTSACAQVDNSTEVKLNQPDKTKSFSLMSASESFCS